MPSPSGNLGLLAPVGGDFPSEYRVAIAQHAALLGNAQSVVEGTFANRAAVVATAFPSGVPLGLVYQATDTGVWYQWSGTAWLTVTLYLPPGTLAARPTSPAEGSLYRATDTGLLYEYNGTAWGTVMVAGPWVALAPYFAGGLTLITATGFDVPSVRRSGDVVEFKGGIRNNGSTIAANTPLFTLPSLYFPSAAHWPLMNWAGSVSISAQFTTAGQLQSAGAFPNATTISLDNISYPL
jgi:hypothetical protein